MNTKEPMFFKQIYEKSLECHYKSIDRISSNTNDLMPGFDSFSIPEERSISTKMRAPYVTEINVFIDIMDSDFQETNY